MRIAPPALDRLIRDLTRLPGIGRKTATRLALHILRGPAAEARELAESLLTLHGQSHTSVFHSIFSPLAASSITSSGVCRKSISQSILPSALVISV